MKGSPANMQQHAEYRDVVQEITRYFSEKLSLLNRLGVNDIIIDPGFGFAKTADHNFQILSKLEAFRIFKQPLMVGLSRKSMIHKTLGISPEAALNGSTALHSIALMKGASILRVHDVREAKETVLLVKKTLDSGSRIVAEQGG
jgi:dihydropteroate synthase